MTVIRYSKAFKMQAVREVETGQNCARAVERKYGIKGNGTVTGWVRQLGSGKYGKIIRVEEPDEISEACRLRRQLQLTKGALADAHIELVLEKAFLRVACEQLDQTVEGFKKKARWPAAHQAVECHPELSVVALCELAQMTPQNYYARRSVRNRQEVDLGLVLALVKAEREQQPRLGVRKLYHLIAPELKAAGIKLGRDRLFKELGQAGWLVARKPSEWPKTTQVDPNLPVFKNLVKRLVATGPNQVWVADITYIRTQEAFLYLGLITDRWSRKIVGYHLGETLETKQVLKALVMALQGLKGSERPIHHSDRGCQYASHAYVRAVQQAGLTMSMTEKNHSAENALAERVNGILKQEYWLDAHFENGRHARQATAHGICLYNTRRPHTALKLATPEQVHSAGNN